MIANLSQQADALARLKRCCRRFYEAAADPTCPAEDAEMALSEATSAVRRALSIGVPQQTVLESQLLASGAGRVA